MDYSETVDADSPRDLPLDQTGFYRWLVDNGTPSFKSTMADIERYLNSFGFKKGRDVISRVILWNLQRVHRYYQSVPGG